MRHTAAETYEVIRLVAGADLSVRQTLRELQVNRSTCYAWWCVLTFSDTGPGIPTEYRCLGAKKGACDNRLLVRRALVERVVLAAVRDRLMHSENLDYVFRKLSQEVAKAATATPETIRLKEAEFDAEQQRVANFIEFVAGGRGSRALAKALTASEKRLEDLRTELEGLRRSGRDIFTAPPREWLTERIVTIQTVLERRTERSGLLLRRLLGKIRLEPVTPDIGRPYYRALTNLDALAIMENDPDSPDTEPGSTSLQWWRRRESNPNHAITLTW